MISGLKTKMASILSVGVLIVAASIVVVCESAALEQVQITTPPVGKFPGPCRYIVSS